MKEEEKMLEEGNLGRWGLRRSVILDGYGLLRRYKSGNLGGKYGK